MSTVALRAWLGENASASILSVLVDQLVASVPAPAAFDDDRWNIIGWKLRPGNGRALYLHFDKFSHVELRIACKLWILHGRHARRIGDGSACGKLRALLLLDEILGARPLRTLNNADFYEAQCRLKQICAGSSAYGMAKELEAFATWLNLRTGLRLSYTSGIKKSVPHGRHGGECARSKKLVPDEVIRDLMACPDSR